MQLWGLFQITGHIDRVPYGFSMYVLLRVKVLQYYFAGPGSPSSMQAEHSHDELSYRMA